MTFHHVYALDNFLLNGVRCDSIQVFIGWSRHHFGFRRSSCHIILFQDLVDMIYLKKLVSYNY